MKQSIGVMLGMLCAANALAADPPCITNYKEEGSFFAGRRFTTTDIVPGVKPDVAFKRIYIEGTKSGLTVAQSDKDIGILNFQQLNAGVTNTGAQVNLPWNVTIEEEGDGSRITVAKTTPGGYATSEDFQKKSMCGVIDAARQ